MKIETRHTSINNESNKDIEKRKEKQQGVRARNKEEMAASSVITSAPSRPGYNTSRAEADSIMSALKGSLNSLSANVEGLFENINRNNVFALLKENN